ncbi:ABC transporter ATP-binding protein [uncultured Cohaesibacter sp.]|uniref:energy-coupling factor ABC transporter ATP-binding protein n=1 Tax=uncultured Cohaesibacter sp. TaxID=1002546 RepID=UPI00292D03B5|nr:ABC transporter ATP-binding protein [uncultured Cohaesibacter sp.]
MPELSKDSPADANKGKAQGAGITITRLSHRLDETPIFSNLSVTLTERRIGLIGRNGSGKSTLARLICGLLEPSEGEILTHGADLFKDRKTAMETIGLIFQNPDHQIIFPTVEEEIAFGLENIIGNKKDARRRAKQFLEKFGRADWAERGTYSLSQGQRHLVCLMAVLAMEPKVIILDEPFAGLDWPTTKRLYRWLDALDQQLLMVTHDIEHLESYDRILWLEKGRIVGDGRPEAILPLYRKAMEALVDRDELVLDEQDIARQLAETGAHQPDGEV